MDRKWPPGHEFETPALVEPGLGRGRHLLCWEEFASKCTSGLLHWMVKSVKSLRICGHSWLESLAHNFTSNPSQPMEEHPLVEECLLLVHRDVHLP